MYFPALSCPVLYSTALYFARVFSFLLFPLRLFSSLIYSLCSTPFLICSTRTYNALFHSSLLCTNPKWKTKSHFTLFYRLVLYTYQRRALHTREQDTASPAKHLPRSAHSSLTPHGNRSCCSTERTNATYTSKHRDTSSVQQTRPLGRQVPSAGIGTIKVTKNPPTLGSQ